MSYTPVIPLGGYVGWQFLNRTLPVQQASFAQSAQIERDTQYFKETIGSITSAEQLVDDYRLLSVALAAFGLEDDIQSRHLIKTVIEEGPKDSSALANRLSDSRYIELAEAFQFNDPEASPAALGSAFADDMAARFTELEFERAVGEQDEGLRLALNATRELSIVSESASSENGFWYSVMGNTPLKTVFETAFGLPESFGLLDVDTQQQTLKNKSVAFFGTSDPAYFQIEENIDNLVKTYLLRDQINQNQASQSSASIALTLLKAARR
jgi:hypothetical protein